MQRQDIKENTLLNVSASPSPIASELFIILNLLQESVNILKQEQ